MITHSGDLADETSWYPGFFSSVLHRIADTSGTFDFHGQDVGWSLCGLPVAVVSARGDVPRCKSCGFTSSSWDEQTSFVGATTNPAAQHIA